MLTGVSDTGDKFVAGVSANLRKNVETVLTGYSGAPGETDSWKNLKLKISFQTPFTVTRRFF
jgi:hypothetical protein